VLHVPEEVQANMASQWLYDISKAIMTTNVVKIRTCRKDFVSADYHCCNTIFFLPPPMQHLYFQQLLVSDVCLTNTKLKKKFAWSPNVLFFYLQHMNIRAHSFSLGGQTGCENVAGLVSIHFHKRKASWFNRSAENQHRRHRKEITSNNLFERG